VCYSELHATEQLKTKLCFSPSKTSHTTTTIIPPANAEISVALMTVLITFRIKDTNKLYSVLPMKNELHPVVWKIWYAMKDCNTIKLEMAVSVRPEVS
jgi:hypothetical protein